MINGSRHRGKRNPATAGVSGRIIIARDESKRAYGIAGVDRQQCIERAKCRVERDGACRWGGPVIPNRIAARFSGMVWFTAFFGGVGIIAGDRTRSSRNRGRSREIVVGRRHAGAQRRDRAGNKSIGIEDDGLIVSDIRGLQASDGDR